MAPPTLPKFMLAWTHTARGPPSKVLHLTEGVPIRRPKKPSEVLVKISYAALNPGGSIMLHFCPMFLRHSPAIPEMDFSGTIVAIGPEKKQRSSSGQEETDALIDRVSERGLVLGAEVFGSVLVPEHIGGGHGSLAEYILVDSSCLVKRPQNAKMEEVAGLGVAGCTALVLVQQAEIKRGDCVLVNGASGGIGTMVVQLAKEIVGDSGRVAGVCSEKNVEAVRSLGADEVIAYDTHAPVGNYLGQKFGSTRFDVVIDAVGIQHIWETSASFLKEDGLFVTAGIALKDYTFLSMLHTAWLMMLKNVFQPVWLGGVPRKYIRVMGLVTPERLQELGRMVEEGKLKVTVDSIWEMEDVQKAYRLLLGQRARGKVIIRIEDA